jgi:hypothetical protein
MSGKRFFKNIFIINCFVYSLLGSNGVQAEKSLLDTFLDAAVEEGGRRFAKALIDGPDTGLYICPKSNMTVIVREPTSNGAEYGRYTLNAGQCTKVIDQLKHRYYHYRVEGHNFCDGKSTDKYFKGNCFAELDTGDYKGYKLELSVRE